MGYMEIKIRRRCPDECEDGKKRNEEWERFYRAVENGEDGAGFGPELWFMDLGYKPHEIPEEFEICCECCGTGWVEDWISVEELKKNFYHEEPDCPANESRAGD